MSNDELPPKPARASTTEMTEYVMPTHANVLGNVFGGQILAWMDLCAAICAERHTGRQCVTAGIDDLAFENPVKVGQVVHLCARVTATFRTSLELHVHVEGEDTRRGTRWTCVTAFVTFVCIDDHGKPAPFPKLQLESDDDRRTAAEAAERRSARLAKAKRAG